jgi:bifunctional oligoribonuclease and PAP phosphatase NrnA
MDIPEELLTFIESKRLFFVVGHKEPDGDCVSSQLALTSLLTSLGKVAYACSSGPFQRPEIKSYEKRFQDSIPFELKGPNSAVIVVDCSNLQRTGKLAESVGGLPVAVIDHHSASDGYGDVLYVDSGAPSVSFMIFKLFERLNISPTQEEAELMLFGLCTDTGFFRHCTEASEEIFMIASRMVRAGASPKKAFSMMYGGKSFASRQLMGEILSRAERYFDGRLIISYESLDDADRFGLESRDSDMLYQLLQSVEGCEAIIIIRQESVHNCTVGFRSRDKIDVGSLAAGFGGGGHKNAAGLSIAGKIETIREKLLAAFKEIL